MFGEVLSTSLLKKGRWKVSKNNTHKNETFFTLEANSEAYSEPCQTSKVEVFAKNRQWLLVGNYF